MELLNFMEEVVSRILDELLAEKSEYCDCPRCRLDTMALALNKLPPKYVVTTKGYSYAKTREIETQFRTDILVALTKALQAVKENPSH